MRAAVAVILVQGDGSVEPKEAVIVHIMNDCSLFFAEIYSSYFS